MQEPCTTTNTGQGRERRCVAKTLEGEPCKNRAASGKQYCWRHKFSRTQDCPWWKNTLYQFFIGIAVTLVGTGATIFYGQGGATKEQTSEIRTDMQKLIAMVQTIAPQKALEFEKEFPLGYQLFAFAKNEFFPFSTGKSNVFLRVHPAQDTYALTIDANTIRLNLPTITLVSSDGKETLTMRRTEMKLQNKVGAKCVLHFRSDYPVTLDTVSFDALGRSTNTVNDFGAHAAAHSRTFTLENLSLVSLSGTFMFSPRPDLSFVTKCVQTPTNGALIVFGLKPFSPASLMLP